jgi:ribosomal protein L16 Arg81 hydroxylase
MSEINSTFLMANLGSEVTRIILAKEKKDSELMQKAYHRFTKVFEELYSCKDVISRRDELDILRSVIDSLMEEVSEIEVSPEHLKSYFVPFATKALRENGVIKND